MFGMLYGVDQYFVIDVSEQHVSPTFVHKDAPLGHAVDQRIQSSSILYPCDIS
jgi:hypothetical protein